MVLIDTEPSRRRWLNGDTLTASLRLGIAVLLPLRQWLGGPNRPGPLVLISHKRWKKKKSAVWPAPSRGWRGYMKRRLSIGVCDVSVWQPPSIKIHHTFQTGDKPQSPPVTWREVFTFWPTWPERLKRGGVCCVYVHVYVCVFTPETGSHCQGEDEWLHWQVHISILTQIDENWNLKKNQSRTGCYWKQALLFLKVWYLVEGCWRDFWRVLLLLKHCSTQRRVGWDGGEERHTAADKPNLAWEPHYALKHFWKHVRVSSKAKKFCGNLFFSEYLTESFLDSTVGTFTCRA